ncbi:hypothetical protein F4009_08170 [Candidatus Poribacteria bacterium]|nr:hypothetical protein [Candidatus Poribacteria bacterium]MYA71144.1 hypothetical protein [Candidatus Poribacteria bacterium]MYH80101.1 hypothetical protein [Candidatus Poribacteria bacterium]MYK93959.1 hypothetical protein [Candidatus Poribacteria bacterium]
MTFSYDEVDDFDETDTLDEADDFEEEPQDVFLEEDDDDPDTALSQAFRQAAGTIVDEDETDDEDDEDDDPEADAGTEAEEDHPEAEADTEEDNAADANTDEQQLIEPVEALPDENEDDLEVELPPLELVPTELEVELFRPQEQSNAAYRDARTAYYEENDYQRAIEKFNEAIEYEVQSTEGSLTDANEIVAKSKYWQAEAYVKLQDLPQAIGTFEDLAKTCQGHYLSLAAQRRADQLNTKNS